jgi:two-component system LytT family response regulator
VLAVAEAAQIQMLRYRLNPDFLFLVVGSRHRFLRVGWIVTIRAAGDYSELLLADGSKGLVLKALKEWESRLPPQYFFRIHRSAIINVEYVERIEELHGLSLKVHMKVPAEPLLISRRYALRLKQQLG